MQARTVKLGNYNSADLNITLISVVIGGAEAKLLNVDVPYSNGILDMTDIFGDVRYNNREIEMEFHIPYGIDHFATYANVSSLFNGKKTTITFSADDAYYWEGRIFVDQLACEEGKWAFTMIAYVYPFKRKIEETTKTGVAMQEGTTITCVSSRMPTVPSFTFGGAAVVTFEGKSYSTTTAGTVSWPELILKEGNNSITMKGASRNVSYTVKYREGSL